MMKEIGVVGFGAFGQFMVNHLSKHFTIHVYDTNNRIKEAEALGVKLSGFDEVVNKEIVILAMPMDKLESVLIQMNEKTKKGALIMDICSLKGFAEELMKKHLKDVEIIGTHPLFGPQSAANGIEGCKIALCNFEASKETFGKVKAFCEKLGLKVYVTNSEEHDKQMAVSQAMTHFVGMALHKSNVERVDMSTKTFDKLMDIVDIVKNDSLSLFDGMHVFNREAKGIRKKFIDECKKSDEYLSALEDK